MFQPGPGGSMRETGQTIPVQDTSELFEGLSGSVCGDIISTAHAREYECGEPMFFMGDPIEGVLLLTEGSAKLTQVSEDGAEVINRLCSPGEVVSALAMVLGGTHRSTAIALQRCKALAWDTPTFEAVLEPLGWVDPGLICSILTRARSIFLMMSSTVALQRNGLGFLFQACRNASIACCRSGALTKLPRRIAFSVNSRNQRSTKFSQLELVGTKWPTKRGSFFSHACTCGSLCVP